jgi:hypothetical protein
MPNAHPEECFETWNSYLDSERLGISRSEAFQRINSSEYRHAIKSSTASQNTEWSHRAFTEITRIPKIEARVAKILHGFGTAILNS